MGWLGKLFGGKTSGDSGGEDYETLAEHLIATAACRDRYWAGVGSLEDDLLGNLISPELMGGESWPTTRQAYCVVRTGRSVVLATDGLSDPFDGFEGSRNGFEMELYLETRDLDPDIAGPAGQVDSLKSSWALVVLKQVAALIANVGGVISQLEAYGVLSVELPGLAASPHVAQQMPARFLTEEGALGVLLGISATGRSEMVEGPLSPFRMVAVTVITATELERVRAGGRAERTALAEQLASGPDGHFSDLKRPSLA